MTIEHAHRFVFAEEPNHSVETSRPRFVDPSAFKKEADFWNFGPLGISPVEQVKLLKNVYDGKLPFSKRNIDILKRVMITEQNPSGTIHAKTGWTMAGGINTGWWVGYLRKKDKVYFFATQLLQDRKNNRADFSRCRKDITRAVLRDLQLIN